MTAPLDSTLSQWLSFHAANRPDAVALVTHDGNVSYAELAADVSRLVSGFAKIGIGRGDAVAAQLPNNREYVVALLAAAGRGAIFQTLHMPYGEHELRYLLRDSDAKAVLSFGAEKSAAMVSLAGELGNLSTVISVGADCDGAVSYKEVASTGTRSGDSVATAPDDPFLLLYTSGTTAEPKGVPHTYRGFLNNALLSASELNIGENSCVLSLAALTHLYGLFTLQLSLASGGASALLPAFNPQTLFDDLVSLRPDAVFAAPAHFAPFVSAGTLTAEHLAGIRLLCLSGATVPPPLANTLDQMMKNGEVIQLWGMSELQAGAYGRPGEPLEKRITTTGTASPRTQLRVVDGDEQMLGADEEGALEVKGPSVFGGYLNKPNETDAAFTQDGWFRTGDLAKIDADGFVTLTGRSKELINRGGVKYNPVEIEIEVMKLPQVVQCAIVPVVDDVLGERGCLCVQLLPDQKLALETVISALSEAGIAKYKWPERLEILEELPMTPTRKVMRGRLANMIQDGKE
ncbi:MAG: class I adenylate-forming enzyme family protein [Rhizobiaceae bacterium]